MNFKQQLYSKQPPCSKKQLYSKQQSGFVLILALVMLAVLTLIGVSSMDSANMELKATANAGQHLIAYTATQSLLEYSVSQPVVSAKTINYQRNDPALFPVTLVPTPAQLNITNVSSPLVTLSLIGCDSAIGGSLQAGRAFSYSYFNVAGTASNLGGTASSIMSQGVRFPAAACT